MDLNTLHALSQTCRQFHTNLTPYRQQLTKRTLRCENEYIETLSDMLNSGVDIPDSIKSVIQLLSQSTGQSGRMTRGKVSKCARDMVGECRRCSKVICRVRCPESSFCCGGILTASLQNCTIKTPTNAMLNNRIRRLCTTCHTVPISEHIAYSSVSPNTSSQEKVPPFDPSSFTASAFMRTPCACEDAVWLCYQCGHTIRREDTTYRRVWAWRTRYSTHLGGLGTGIGEGCQGVKCGRGESCLAVQGIELEMVSEADDDPKWLHNHGLLQHADDNDNNMSTPDDEEPGYFRQEIIGIGGRFKQKIKKRITVGACVPEYEDERDTGRYLLREEEGKHRGWCGWCWRVIPAKNETI